MVCKVLFRANVEYAKLQICIACNLIAFLDSVTRRLDLNCYLTCIYKSGNKTGDFKLPLRLICLKNCPTL